MSLAFAEFFLASTGFIAGAVFITFSVVNAGAFGLLLAVAIAVLVTTYMAAFGRYGTLMLATGGFGGSVVAAVVSLLVLMTWG